MTATGTVVSPLLSEPEPKPEPTERTVDPNYAATVEDGFIEPHPDRWFASLRRQR
ncbi:hypothetical protein ACFWIB_14415 [Streptomyces sp. NPDC127051]|uniref:hypothetical protein n=1 Tax=Streptomyces sp. NPDC127051 TaxID=3347119 RepID=UPI0036479BBE